MSRRSSRPVAAQNLDVEHFRATLEEAAEEARGFSLRETADVGTPAPLPDTSSISMIARCWRMPRDRSSSVA